MLHLVGHFVCIYIENDARNHEPKIQTCHSVSTADSWHPAAFLTSSLDRRRIVSYK
jgi:hypothetical protein